MRPDAMPRDQTMDRHRIEHSRKAREFDKEVIEKNYLRGWMMQSPCILQATHVLRREE